MLGLWNRCGGGGGGADLCHYSTQCEPPGKTCQLVQILVHILKRLASVPHAAVFAAAPVDPLSVVTRDLQQDASALALVQQENAALAARCAELTEALAQAEEELAEKERSARRTPEPYLQLVFGPIWPECNFF